MLKSLMGVGVILSLVGCASTEIIAEGDSYSRNDISIVLSTKFDSAQSEAARALKPSYEKFGAPKRYVSGNMSAVYESAENRLYGTGDLFARYTPAQPIFWQIDGAGLTANVDPIKTVHLLYDKQDLPLAPYAQIKTEIRRGKSFTVFEQDLGQRLVVSIYPSQKLPKDAELEEIYFQNE